jgi:hypothetical protein
MKINDFSNSSFIERRTAMNLKNKKDNIISEIMVMRGYLWDLNGIVYDEELQKIKDKLDKIQDMVFGL